LGAAVTDGANGLTAPYFDVLRFAHCEWRKRAGVESMRTILILGPPTRKLALWAIVALYKYEKAGFEAKADIALTKEDRLLEKADMTVADIVKVTQYLTRAEDIKAYAKIRAKYLGDARPAFMLLVIPQLVWPEILVEVEVIAAKAGTKA
jgi:hypothetical protein